MDIEGIKRTIDDIELFNNEEAHILEDSLVEHFVKYAAEHSRDEAIKALAIEVAKVYDIDYCKWYS